MTWRYQQAVGLVINFQLACLADETRDVGCVWWVPGLNILEIPPQLCTEGRGGRKGDLLSLCNCVQCFYNISDIVDVFCGLTDPQELFKKKFPWWYQFITSNTCPHLSASTNKILLSVCTRKGYTPPPHPPPEQFLNSYGPSAGVDSADGDVCGCREDERGRGRSLQAPRQNQNKAEAFRAPGPEVTPGARPGTSPVCETKRSVSNQQHFFLFLFHSSVLGKCWGHWCAMLSWTVFIRLFWCSRLGGGGYRWSHLFLQIPTTKVKPFQCYALLEMLRKGEVSVL